MTFNYCLKNALQAETFKIITPDYDLVQVSSSWSLKCLNWREERLFNFMLPDKIMIMSSLCRTPESPACLERSDSKTEINPTTSISLKSGAGWVKSLDWFHASWLTACVGGFGNSMRKEIHGGWGDLEQIQHPPPPEPSVGRGLLNGSSQELLFKTPGPPLRAPG